MIKRGPELRLATYCLLLYTIFITWGYLQEKITSSFYLIGDVHAHWDFPTVLNLFMTMSATFSALMVEIFMQNDSVGVQYALFWRCAMTAALASPIGYQSLKYISYPMMILTKSSKHVPVMVVGKLFYRQNYEWYKYISVLMVCGGIGIFSVGKGFANVVEQTNPSLEVSNVSNMITGVVLVVLNLSLDGVTNNEQDKLFKTLNTTSMQMMKYLNIWQAIYLGLYLTGDLLIYKSTSNIIQAFDMMSQSASLSIDIALFCICGCVGQIIMFGLIKEFGSLVWITVSVTRQLFTILLSVFIFNHTIKLSQWLGIAIVFSGLGLEIFYNYHVSYDRKSL